MGIGDWGLVLSLSKVSIVSIRLPSEKQSIFVLPWTSAAAALPLMRNSRSAASSKESMRLFIPHILRLDRRAVRQNIHREAVDVPMPFLPKGKDRHRPYGKCSQQDGDNGDQYAASVLCRTLQRRRLRYLQIAFRQRFRCAESGAEHLKRQRRFRRVSFMQTGLQCFQDRFFRLPVAAERAVNGFQVLTDCFVHVGSRPFWRGSDQCRA